MQDDDTGPIGYVDQSGGTSDTYGVLAGAINGSNTTYTVSQGAYNSGSLKVYLNGQLQTQGSSEDWIETLPSGGTFDFATAPVVGDEITVEYELGSSSAGVQGNIILTKTANYTILGSEASGDIYIVVDATSGNITIDLPAANSFGAREIHIGKVDSTLNTVTIDGDGSETINGSTTFVINAQYTWETLISDGTQWFLI